MSDVVARTAQLPVLLAGLRQISRAMHLRARWRAAAPRVMNPRRHTWPLVAPAAAQFLWTKSKDGSKKAKKKIEKVFEAFKNNLHDSERPLAEIVVRPLALERGRARVSALKHARARMRTA